MVRELGLGGCERDLTKLARGIDRTRFVPHVGCIHPSGIRRAELEAADVPIVQLPITSLISPSYLSGARILGRYIRDHEIRVVHTFDAAMDMVAVPIAWFYRVPVVVKSHLGFRDDYPTRVGFLFPITDRMTDGFVANSRAVQADLVDHGVAAGRTHLCYNGVDTSIFRPSADAHDNDGAIVIGTICALRPEKRLDWLVEAFARIRKRLDNVRLLVVGSGSVREMLERQAAALGIGDVTRFEPATQDVPSWLRRIDVFALTSETESFPNALLEAMACGRCVVASNVGGVPEMVDEGKNGLLFEVGNVDQLAAKLALAAQDPALRRTLGEEAARTAAERFSIERNVRCIESVYEALLARSH
jgi:glycosyltransferase involved in cell wall biosynthesis